MQPLLILSIVDFATLSAVIFASLATESEDVLSIDESKWSIKPRCVHLSLLCDLQIRIDLKAVSLCDMLMALIQGDSTQYVDVSVACLHRAGSLRYAQS